MGPSPRVLVVEHQAICPPAWVGDWLSSDGVELDVVRPYRDDALPSSLDGAAGLLVLGGSMGANDDARYPWLTGTKALLRQAVDAGVPALGVCLGHQLLVTACGGVVEPNPGGKQLGVLDVGLTEAAADDALLGGLRAPVRAVQWNDDIAVRLPADAATLAATPDGVPQAVRVGPVAWGVQFHPEVGAELVTEWATKDEERVRAAGGDVRAALRAIAAAETELVGTWRPVVHRFAAVLRR